MTNSVRQWSEAAVRLGHDCSIIYHDHSGQHLPETRRGVQWVPLKPRFHGRAEAPLGLADALVGSDVAVFHSAWTTYNLIGGRTARRRQVPYVLEPRGAYDPHIVHRNALGKQLWWRGGEGRLVRSARAMHAFFEEERAHFTQLGWQGPVVISTNGVDVPSEFAWDGGSSGDVVWLGRFDPHHKGLDLLLCAMASLPPSSRPSLRLYGPDWRGRKASVQKMIEQLDLGSSVTIFAPVFGREKYEVLSRSLAFVYPSRWEACSNSVADAAALGIPLLTTNYPLGRHLAARGGAVSVAPTTTDLARGLLDVTQPGAASLGRGARKWARESTWSNVAERWLRQVGDLL